MTDPRSGTHSGDVSATCSSTPTTSSDFGSIYRAHFGYVCRLLHKYGVARRDLEDAAHEVFMVVHRRLPECTPQSPVKPWLVAICFRTASDWRRRAFQRQDLSVELPDAPDSTPNAESVAADRQALGQVMQVLEWMDEDKRTVFVLHEVEGHAMPDVAAAVGIPLNTAYSRLRLARSQFVTMIRQVRRESQDETQPA